MEGLLMKYFVLNPSKTDGYGGASRAALRTYAEKIDVENPALARDLHAWLAKLEPKAGVVPRVGSLWVEQGGHYAGVMRGDDGQPDYHLIDVDGEQESIKWKEALAWAKGLTIGTFTDCGLPKRKEQAVLFGNVPERFAKGWYWSCEQSASYDDSAWCQDFGNGYQSSHRKDDSLRARAVRRLPIQ